MAARQRPHGRKQEIFSCEVPFQGLIESSVRAKLLIEFIKFIIYQRQQIPMPVDQIKQEVVRDQLEQKPHESLSPAQKAKYRRAANRPNTRSKQDILDKMEDIITVMQEVFIMSTRPIKQVLVIIGATVVSPKEYYLIRLPTSCYDGPLLELKACMSVLFRKLVSCDVTSDLKAPSPTKITVLVYAPRDCDNLKSLNGFRPRVNYKPPTRGKRIVIDFLYSSQHICANSSFLGDTEFNVSGIEPLDQSDMELSIGAPHAHSSRRVSLTESGIMDIGSLNSTGLDKDNMNMQESLCTITEQYDDPEYVWYQCSAVMKGYKERAQKSTACPGRRSIFL